MTDLISQTLADPAIGAFGTAVVLAVVALWLAAAWWAYTDASRRTESSLAGYVAAGWIILSSPLLLPLSLATYTFARPQVPAADQRTKSLAAELGATMEPRTCVACATPVDDEWLRCPSCSTWLASPCAHCDGWSDATLETCPWCGSEGREEPFVEQFAPETAPARGRRRRIPWRATVPAGRSQRREGQRAGITPGARSTTRVKP